jgi:hypothetical protein
VAVKNSHRFVCSGRDIIYSRTLVEAPMANTNLASMSVDALLKLREDIEKVLSRKAAHLKDQIRG